MSTWAASATSRRRILLVAAVCAAVLAVYLVRLGTITRTEVLRGDYMATQTGGTLVAAGQGADLYNDSVQSGVYGRLVAGDHGGDLLFNHAPLTAVMNAPISGLDPVAGHLLWGLLQFLLVVVGCGLVAAVAPWPASMPRALRAAAVLVALVGAGTVPMLTEGQDLGTITLGLALAYTCWRRGRLGTGAAALLVGAAIAKPHLALGLAAFMAGWRDRRVIAGAIVGAGAALALSVAAVGWTACVAFVAAGLRTNGLGAESLLVGFSGLLATWLGSGTATSIAAGVLALSALAGAFALGAAVRRDRGHLGPALAGATLLSLLASPHTFSHDLVLLAPILVLALAEARRRASAATWPTAAERRVLVLWLVLIAASGVDSTVALPAAAGKLTTFVLLLAAAVAVRTVGQRRGGLSSLADHPGEQVRRVHGRVTHLLERGEASS